DVIYHVQNVCDEVEVPHPTIITESGRAIAAYHSVLVFNVLGVSGMGEGNVPSDPPPDAEQPLIDLAETYRGLTAKTLLESYHDAQQARQLGDQAALSAHADPPAGRAAHSSRRAGRHHLRFRRQSGRLHRSPRRQAYATVAHLRRRQLLPGRIPAGRLPGNPGRHA